MAKQETNIDTIVAAYLRDLIKSLEEPCDVPRVSHDPEEEAKWLRKKIKAAKRIHNYISLEKI